MTDPTSEGEIDVRPSPSATFPRWLREVDSSLAVTTQYILTGNTRDSFLVSNDVGARPVKLVESLWQVLSGVGFKTILVYDPVDGIRCHPPAAEGDPILAIVESIIGKGLNAPHTLEWLREQMANIVRQRDHRIALVIDYADRLVTDPTHLGENERIFFAAAQKLSHTALQIGPPPGVGRKIALYNPIFWIANSERDLPSWLYVGNGRVRVVPIALPDMTERVRFASQLARDIEGFESLTVEQADEAVNNLANSTEGFSADEMDDVTRLAFDQKVEIREIDDAARLYRVGVNENPWKQDAIRERIGNGQEIIERRVRGQGDAVQKSLDILVRSATGLTGAQTSAHSTKPRGVLFFAGPTGVGKTEFAKSLTELIFGDERAYIRLDMSEYSSEHAEARLVGSPPGYVGHDAGGQLTEAVRQRPFSLVLFDEIEKAHPRILDKFLQVLDDGRLTDGTGRTVHFSETILVFTSNLGISVVDATGNRVPNVTREDDREEFETKIRSAITDHFVVTLGRPELLNRFGDNIVVFDFIDEATGTQIFEIQLKNIAGRISQEYRATLEIDDAVRTFLLEAALRNLDLGGRGIGSVLETALVNPLARATFADPPAAGSTLRVIGCREVGRNYEIDLA